MKADNAMDDAANIIRHWMAFGLFLKMQTVIPREDRRRVNSSEKQSPLCWTSAGQLSKYKYGVKSHSGSFSFLGIYHECGTTIVTAN